MARVSAVAGFLLLVGAVNWPFVRDRDALDHDRSADAQAALERCLAQDEDGRATENATCEGALASARLCRNGEYSFTLLDVLVSFDAPTLTMPGCAFKGGVARP